MWQYSIKNRKTRETYKRDMGAEEGGGTNEHSGGEPR